MGNDLIPLPHSPVLQTPTREKTEAQPQEAKLPNSLQGKTGDQSPQIEPSNQMAEVYVPSIVPMLNVAVVVVAAVAVLGDFR